MADAAPAVAGPGFINNLPWIVSLVTLISTIIFSVYLKGLLSQPVSYTHLRAHETVLDLVCRLLLEKKKKVKKQMEKAGL